MVAIDRDTAFEMAVAAVRYGAGVTREVGNGPRRSRRPSRAHRHRSRGREAASGTRRRRLARCQRREVGDVRPRSRRADRGVVARCDRLRARPDVRCDRRRRRRLVDRHGEGRESLHEHPPADFLDYVNKPIGKGLPVPGPLKPLFAIPTTAGTGSETTGVAIFDLTRLHVKTGISSRLLKPTLGFLDPDHTRTAPPAVAASCGLDILCHAVESYTAIPFTDRPRPERPSARPPYQGANPISDVWSLQAMRMVATHLVRAVEDPDDDEARASMVLAASFAGIGFGNAGVHLPHAMAYPVAGGVKQYRAPGYPATTRSCRMGSR